MSSKLLITLGVALFSLSAGIIARLLISQGDQHDAEIVDLLSFSVMAVSMYIGCAALFLSGLKGFTAKSKLAYGIFCAGVIFFALSELQIPIIALIGGEAGRTWLGGAGLLLMLLLGIGAMYAGIKIFAGLFDVRSIWRNAWFTTIFAIVAAAGAYFIPVGPAITTQEEAHGSMAIITISLVLFAASTVLLYHIQHKTTSAYRQAMRWFYLAVLGFTVANFITIIAFITVGSAHPFISHGYSLLIQAVLALILLKAAHEFNLIGTPSAAVSSNEADIIDIITATAAKVSNSQAVDAWLDNLRVVTSRLRADEQLSKQDEALLIQTYKQLERYLAEEEPVRRYTKRELRHILHNELRISGHSFLDDLS